MKSNKAQFFQRGASLVETIMAIGILGIVVGAASTYFAQSGATLRIENAKETQSALAARMQSALSNPDAITNSILFGVGEGNTALKDCVSASGNCVITKANSAMAFTLYDAGDQAVRMASPTGEGYDPDGKKCTPGSQNCIFTAIVKFWATCGLSAGPNPTPLSACVPAKFINFKFQVQVAKQMMQGKSAKLFPFPSDAVYNNALPSSAVRMRVADINARLGGECGQGKIGTTLKMTGIDQNGKPICKCLNGGDPDAAGNCPNQRCAAKNSIMVGFKPQSPGSPILVPECINQQTCQNDTTGLCPCVDVDLATNGDCGEGYWMVSINYGQCTASTGKNKNAPETVSCTKKRGRCCKLDVQ